MRSARFFPVMMFPIMALMIISINFVPDQLTQANGESFTPAISDDGRWVAFSSFASNLVEGDTNGHADIFLFDRLTGETKMITRGADGDSMGTAINGQYVDFRSQARNLVDEAVNEGWNLFRYDTKTTEISLLKLPPVISTATTRLFPSMSADGRFIVYESLNGISLHDTETHKTEILSEGYAPVISADGEVISFIRTDGNTSSLYVYLRETGNIKVVSAIQENTLQPYDEPPVVSPDGRFVGFVSALKSLVLGDRNDTWDVFLYDRLTGAMQLVSVGEQGIQGNGSSGEMAMSADARYIAFQSNASNLVPGDTNGVADIFVVDRQTGEISRISGL